MGGPSAYAAEMARSTFDILRAAWRKAARPRDEITLRDGRTIDGVITRLDEWEASAVRSGVAGQ